MQKYHDLLVNNNFQRILVLVGCVIFQMKIILALAEKQDWEGEYQKDKTEQKMFELFAEGIEDLYTKVLEPYIKKTPVLRDAFAMRWWQHHTATTLPPPTHPTHPTKDNVHLSYILTCSATSDFHRNCADRLSTEKLEETQLGFVARSFVVFCDIEQTHWL